MKKLKDFIKNKKVNNQFKGLGEGYSLNAPTNSVKQNKSFIVAQNQVNFS